MAFSVLLSREQCMQFLADPSRNPVTGRKLTSDQPGSTKHKFKKYCENIFNQTPQQEAYSAKCKAPWMGPVIHPEFTNASKFRGSDKERYNVQVQEWCDHLQKRIPEILGSELYSKMELEDLVKSLNYLIKGAHDSPYLARAKQNVSQVKKLLKSDKLVDDYKEFDQPMWVSFTLKKDRYHFRKYISEIHARIYESLQQMTDVINNPKHAKSYEDDVSIARFLRFEEFLDLLIKKCYFREEDIFGTLFPDGRNVFKILQDTYKRFKKAQATSSNLNKK